MKLNLEIVTPGNGKSYEFEISDKLTVLEVKKRIIIEINSFENNNIIVNPNNSVLCSEKNQNILDDNSTFQALEVKSGDSLFLI